MPFDSPPRLIDSLIYLGPFINLGGTDSLVPQAVFLSKLPKKQESACGLP